eukprot:scaffold1486_cov314-Pavlova_lutheri.AAC.4
MTPLASAWETPDHVDESFPNTRNGMLPKPVASAMSRVYKNTSRGFTSCVVHVPNDSGQRQCHQGAPFQALDRCFVARISVFSFERSLGRGGWPESEPASTVRARLYSRAFAASHPFVSQFHVQIQVHPYRGRLNDGFCACHDREAREQGGRTCGHAVVLRSGLARCG